MSKFTKIILSVIVVFGLIFGGLIFYVTSQIKPEDIRKLIIEVASKNLPGANVELQKIDYSIGTSLTLDVVGLNIKTKEIKGVNFNNNELFKVETLKVKIPLWAILTQGGVISVSIASPSINFEEVSPNINSINHVLGTKSDTNKAEVQEKKDAPAAQGSFEVPSFVSRSKINVKFNDVLVQYSLLNGMKGKTSVNRIILKDIGLNSVSAFEIASDIEVNLDKNSKLSTNLLVIGDVDLQKFLKGGDIFANAHITMSKINANFVPIAIPDIKTSMKIKLDKAGTIENQLKLEIGSVVGVRLNAIANADAATIDNLDVKVNLEQAVELMPDLKTSLQMISLNGSEVYVNGNLKLNLKSSKLTNDINFGLTKNIIAKIIEDLPVEQNFNGTFKNENVQVVAKTMLAGGEISSTVTTKVSPLSQSFEMDKLSPIDIKVIGGNSKITKEFIQKFLYKSKGATAEAPIAAADQAKPAPITPVKLPEVKINLDLRQIYIDKAEIKVSGNIFAKGNKVNSKDLLYSFDQGQGKGVFEANMINSATTKTTFSFNMKNLDFSSFNAFLPQIEFLKGLEGMFNGEIGGNFNMNTKGMDYNVNADVNILKAKALGLAALKDKITPHLSKVKFVDENDFHIPDNFDAIKAKVNATEKMITIKNADFLGPQRSLDVVQINGNVSMLDQPSKIDLKVKLKNPEKVEKWKKQFKTDAIDIRLVGRGFGLGLDTDAFVKTVTNMAKNALVSEVKSKAKEKVEEKKEQLKEEAKNKLKDMFKKKFKF